MSQSLAALVLLSLAATTVAAEPIAARYARQGLIRPLLKPGQSLAEGIELRSQSSRRVEGAEEWTHFAGKSRLTGDRVIGVVQRWVIPAEGLGPKDLLACLLEAGTLGRDAQGPRFLVKAARRESKWRRCSGAELLFDPHTEGSIVRGDNIRPRFLSGLYHANAFNMYVDRSRVVVSDERVELEGQLMNPGDKRGPLPGQQHGFLRLSARRRPGDRIELRKEYVAVEPTSFIATAAPVMRPVSALLGMWSAMPRILRDYTPPGIALKVGASVGSAITDAALGKQMEDLILDRHGDLLHSQAVPNLADAFHQRALRARRP